MSIKVEKLENNIVKLEIKVDKETFEKGMQKSYLHNVKKFNVPGFRKGKAPRKIIESYYGEAVFYEDAVNFVCPEVYEKALQSENIEVVSEPEFDIIQIGDGEDLIFSAKVTVKPEVKLGKYKGIEVKEKDIKISNEEVNSELEKLREKNSRIINVDDRPIQKDDIAVIDFEGFVDGVPFKGGKGENYELTIGSGQFIPGFEEQLVGAKIGDEVDVNVTFPEDYHSKDLSGKETLFKVKVNSIKLKELPKLDDEFAKDISEFDTINELKKSIKGKLHEEAEHKAKNELEDEVIKIAAENAQVDIPEVMVENQIKDMIKDFDMRLRYQGVTLEKYFQLTGTDPKQFVETMKPQALEQVRGKLVLDEIAKAENISVNDEELEQELQKLADNYKQNLEDFKKHLRPEDIKYIREGIIVDKTIKFLVESSKITKKK